MARADDSLVGRTIAGKFAIEAHIGSGAMGQVYRARQVALEKTVAVKVLHQDLARDETFAARFHREAKAASRLDHPNSMRVIDFGAEPDGMLYIAMEYLDGRDLLRVIGEDGPLPEPRIVDILTQALAALVVAHDMGVIHRDLKPENIMILEAKDDEGHSIDIVKVCDFGIAKISGRGVTGVTEAPGRGPITTEGLVVGTPEYMSPEQGRGDPLDARSDLYSVGVILFQLLVGRLPFEGESALGIVFKQVNEPPPVPSSLRPGVDPRLEAACLRALAKRPGDRFQSAREMRSALRGAFGSDGVRRSSAPHTMPRSSDRVLEHAPTLALYSSEALSAPGSTRTGPLGTPSGTAALPALPVSTPSIWAMGGIALLIGAGLTAAVVMKWSRSPEAGSAPAAIPLVVATSPDASASTSAWTSLPASSPSVAPVASVASVAPVLTPSPAAAVGGRPQGPAGVSSPNVAAPQASSATPARFSLETSAASPTVVKSTGVGAREVRAALPSWKFTQCYRDAMQAGNAALEGHVVLDLTLAGNGSVSRVTARGTGQLLSATGNCMMSAVTSATVNATPAPGATAEVDVACTPR